MINNQEKINELLARKADYEKQIAITETELESAKIKFANVKKGIKARFKINESHIELIERELEEYGYVDPAQPITLENDSPQSETAVAGQ